MNTVNYIPQVNNLGYTGKLKTSKSNFFKREMQTDEVTLSNKEAKKAAKKENRKKAMKFLLVAQAISFATVAAVSIGRNPAKVAKVLQGTSEVVNPVYSKMQGTLDSLIQKSGGEYKVNYADLLKDITAPKNMTGLQDKLEDVQKLIEKQETPPSKEIQAAIESLKKKSAEFVDTVVEKRLKGADYDTIRNLEETFARENSANADIIGDYIYDIYSKMNYGAEGRNEINELSKAFGWRFNYSEMTGVKKCMMDCPEDIIGKGQTLFHGTQAPKKVYKNGFTPYVSNQLSRAPRELGAGIYVTPDVKVASHFSSIQGNIIPVKLAEDTKIAFVDEQSYKGITSKINEFLLERIPLNDINKMHSEEKNALMEILYQKIFQDSGYDAAYLPKGMQQGLNLFGGDINKVCGRPQSQVVIFNPEKLQITDRGLKDRIFDFKDKLVSMKKTLEYVHDNPLTALF